MKNLYIRKRKGIDKLLQKMQFHIANLIKKSTNELERLYRFR
jgi:hypothetical protein